MRHYDNTVERFDHVEDLSAPSPWFPHSADSDSAGVIGKRQPLRTDWDERHSCSKVVSRELLSDWTTTKPKPQYYTKPANTPRWDPKSKKAIVAAQCRAKNASVAKSGWAGWCTGKDDARYTLHNFARAGGEIPGPHAYPISDKWSKAPT